MSMILECFKKSGVLVLSRHSNLKRQRDERTLNVVGKSDYSSTSHTKINDKEAKKSTLNDNGFIQLGFTKTLEFIIAVKGQIFEEVQGNHCEKTVIGFRNRWGKKDTGGNLMANHTKI